MATIIQSITGAEALTFDDVLLQPGHSEVMPGQVNIATRIARDFDLNLPIISSAMDTVTEARLAIAMAQAGGIGVIHRNLTPEEQAEQVHQVKKFESGMVVNPVTISPMRLCRKRWRLMKAHGISGIPVVEHSQRQAQRSRDGWSVFSPIATCALHPTRTRRSMS
jgi:IMP dehydrogenase